MNETEGKPDKNVLYKEYFIEHQKLLFLEQEKQKTITKLKTIMVEINNRKE